MHFLSDAYRLRAAILAERAQERSGAKVPPPLPAFPRPPKQP